MQILAPKPDQLDEISDLAGKCFNDYYRLYQHCQGGYIKGSSYDWAASRIVVENGRIVSHVGVWQYRMRVGRARLKTGGIGIVMTDAGHREQGLNAKVFQATMAAMRELGYDYSILFGIKDYYHRFGYCQAWPATELRVELADLPDTPLARALRRQPLTDIQCGQGVVMEIYNRDNATRTGTAERPLYTLNETPYWNDWRLDALVDEAGRTVGYVVWNKNDQELVLMEAGGFTEEGGLAQIIAATRELARQNGCSRVLVAHFSYQHPLVQALRQGTCKVEIQHTRSGGAMGAVINLGGCLKAMEEELSGRLAESRLRDVSTGLAIEGENETVTLALAGGRVSVVAADEAANRIRCGSLSARLILGSEEPPVLAWQGVKYEGDALSLAEVLFPPQWPQLYRLDGF